MKKTKVCNGPTCDKTEWPISKFNKDRSRKDGLAPYCKHCQSHYHKERYKNPEGKKVKLSYNKNFYKTEAGKASRKKAYNQGVKRHPNKRKARAAVNNAIARGKLQRASEFQCNFEGCNEAAQEYHHNSYDPQNWLNVKPYCRYHHRDIDNNRYNI
jgi:hypothetical protein